MNPYLIIIPVYNEAGSVASVAENTIEISSSFADIIFVNDGSSDGSREVLFQLKNKFGQVSVIDKPKNEGYGAGLISGFNYGINNNYEYIITMDCDAQHEPKDIPRFKEFDPEVDVVSGTRYSESSKRSGNAPRDRVEINSRITDRVNRAYGFHLTDTFCGFKRYKTNSLKEHDFSELGYAFPMEFWAYAKFKKLKISELAVDRIYITDDRSFGEDLDKKRKRYKYYLKAWAKAHQRYFHEPIYKKL